MKAFKSFLIRVISSFLVVLPAALCVQCSGTWMATSLENFNALSEEQDKLKIKSYFCNGSNSKRNISQHIIAKMPRIKAGTDLMTAQETKSSIQREYRAKIKRFFWDTIPNTKYLTFSEATKHSNTRDNKKDYSGKLFLIDDVTPKDLDQAISESIIDPVALNPTFRAFSM